MLRESDTELENTNEVDLVFYGDSAERLTEAFQQLQDDVEEDYQTAPDMEEDVIKEFKPKQVLNVTGLLEYLCWNT